jgi:dTDP-L-rhamnose 4-epimerase
MDDLVLLTGGAGTLGRALAQPLLDRGFRVRSVDIRPIEGLPPEVETSVVDLRDPAAVEAVTAGSSRARGDRCDAGGPGELGVA